MTLFYFFFLETMSYQSTVLLYTYKSCRIEPNWDFKCTFLNDFFTILYSVYCQIDFFYWYPKLVSLIRSYIMGYIGELVFKALSSVHSKFDYHFKSKYSFGSILFKCIIRKQGVQQVPKVVFLSFKNLFEF